MLQLGKVYYIRRFRVANSKSQYKVLNAPLMIYLTLYSIIDLCRDPPSTFPLYVYNLTTYDDIDANGPKSKDFHASLYLNGGAACHWNPSITEAEPYYERIHNENIKIELPMLSNEPVTFPNPIEREDKELKVLLESDPNLLPDEGCKCTVTITRILDDQPWWYRACNACPNKPSMQSAVSSCRTCGSTDAILRYKLNFMASDGTAEMRMFCFDNIAKRIIGKPCASLLTSATSTSNIPPDLAAIVSLKFTFVVVYNEMSFQVSEKELFIKSVIASHGRDLTFPSPKLKIPVQPSTPTQLLGAAKQQVSPSSALSKLSTAISPENSPQTEDNLQNEDQNILAFESPPKRARRKSLKFDCDKNLHDE